MARVFLIEAQPWDPATGIVVPVRLAHGGRRHYTHKGFADWFGGVVAPPRFTAEIGFSGTTFTTAVVPQVTAIGFAPSTASAMDRLSRLVWTDAPVIVSSGDDDAAAPAWTVVLAGTFAGYSIAGGSFAWTVSDLAGSLAKPVSPGTFAGTGGLEGITEAAGRPKRASWGSCWNVEARVLDKAANLYELGDPARPLLAIDTVKDKGRAGPLSVVAWAGSAAATLDVLRAAAPPAGGAAVAPSIACLKWWTQASGPLTVDLRGPGATVPAIAALVATAAGVAAPDVAALGAGWDAPAGVHVDDAGESAASLLDRLLLPASLAWRVTPAGAVELLPIAFDAPVATVQVAASEREAAYAPVSTIEVRYRRNHRRHGDAEVSAAILAGDLLFPDGSTGDDLVESIADIDQLRVDVDNALDTVEQAAEALRGASDDGTLTVDEKIRILIPADAKLEAAWQLLDGQAAGIAGDTAVTSARGTASSARQAWLTYRNGLSPAWNNKALPTAVTRSTFNGRLGDYEWSLTNLAQALRDYGLRRTNAAFETVARIGSDGWLTAGSEKQQAEIEFQALVSRLAAVVNRWQGLGQPALTPATALPDAGFALYPEYGPANGRVASLGYYLEHINPSYLSRNTDTQVDPAEWSARWKTAYDKIAIAEAALIGIVGSAVQSAVDAIAVISADGKWSPYEKRSTLLQQHAELEANYTLLNNAAAAIAGSAALDAARSAAGTKRQAWLDFLGTVPSWSNPDVETVVNRGEARSKVVAYGDALNALAEALRIYTDARAATALQRLDDLASDGKLAPEEKWLFVNLWRTLVNRYQRAVDRYLELGLQGGRIPTVTQKQQDAYKALGPDGNAPESSLGKFLGALTPAWDNGAVMTPVPDPAALKAKFEAAASAVDAFILAMSAQPDADNTSSAIAAGQADAAIGSKVATSPKLAKLDANGRATSTRINSIYALRGAQQVYIPTNGNTAQGGTVQAGQPGSPLWSYTDPGGGPTATIQVFDHKLIDDAGTLNFGGGFMFNVQQGTQYWVYEDGAGYTGGNPTYVATTSAEALNAPNRRMVGSTFTPTTARVGAGGGTSGGGGGGGGIRERYYENQLTQQP